MLGGIRRYGEKEHLFCGDIVDERKRRGAYEKEHEEHQRRIPRRKRSHGISVPQRKADNRARRHAQSVFAALFLGMTTPNLKRVWGLAAPQFCFGQLLAWGQYAVGLGIVGFFLLPLFGVPAAFGNLLEIGFEGGHGTVAGLSQTFDQLGWAIGKDLGFTMATIGMILGITLGMAMINFAARRGYIGNIRNFKDCQ